MQLEPANTLQWLLWRWGELHPGDLQGLRGDVIDAMREIARCGTGGLGWREYTCIEHGNEYRPNTCRRRDCPQCIGDQAFKWCCAIENLMLDCPHFHVVFTLSDAVNRYWRYNREMVANVLLGAAAASLQYLLRDSNHMGGTPAIMGALHTHGGGLPIHLHGHFVVSSEGLAPDGTVVPAKRPMLLPFKALRRTFQKFFLRDLQDIGRRGDFVLPPGFTALDFRRFIARGFRQPQSAWNVRIFRRDDVRPVIRYLSRTAYGGAIRNDRIKSVSGDEIVFLYQDWRGREEGSEHADLTECRMSLDEFVRRWQEHIHPKGFKTIRYYGLLAPGNRGLLNAARQALEQRSLPPEPSPDDEPKPEPAVRCKHCQRPMTSRELPPTQIVLSPAARALLPRAADSPFLRRQAAS